MSIQVLQTETIAIDQEIAQLENSVSLALVKELLNLIERVVKENNTLLTERQQLRDEINRLKGEQGKDEYGPGIRALIPILKAIVMNESEFNAQLTRIDTLGSRQSVHLTEASAIAYYQQQTDFPIFERLLADSVG